MLDVTFFLMITPSLDRETFSGSVDAGFVLALLFCHGHLEADCARSFDEGGSYARDKNTSARLSTKNAGGLMREWGRICGTLQYI